MAEKEHRQTEMPEIDLFCILRDLLHDWWMILTAGIMAVMVAYLFIHLAYVPEYTSTATLIVSAKSGTSGAATDISTTTNMANTFSRVLDSKILKKKVQQELGMKTLPGEIRVSVVPNTNLLNLSVTAGQPDEAFRVLRGVIDNYNQVTDYIMKNAVLNELEPPIVPTSPSNRLNERRTLVNAFIFGAAAMGILLGILSYQRDDIKNEKEIPQKLDTKLFATVYHEQKYKTLDSWLKRAKSSILITSATSSFLFVETFKKIRTKLMYLMGEKKSKVLLVTSVAENEGKSTVAVNIALALAQKRERVVLIDGDLRRPSLYKLLSRKVPLSGELASFLEGNRSADKLMQCDQSSGLHMILGTRSCPNSTELVAGKQMRGLIDAVRKVSDYVVIDSPPMALMADAEILSEYADVSLLIVRQNMSQAGQINDAIDALEKGHSELLGCIFNNVKTRIFSGTKNWNYGYGYGYGYGKYNKYGRCQSGTEHSYADGKSAHRQND